MNFKEAAVKCEPLIEEASVRLNEILKAAINQERLTIQSQNTDLENPTAQDVLARYIPYVTILKAIESLMSGRNSQENKVIFECFQTDIQNIVLKPHLDTINGQAEVIANSSLELKDRLLEIVKGVELGELDSFTLSSAIIGQTICLYVQSLDKSTCRADLKDFFNMIYNYCKHFTGEDDEYCCEHDEECQSECKADCESNGSSD